jgi:hypothetical protein
MPSSEELGKDLAQRRRGRGGKNKKINHELHEHKANLVAATFACLPRI